MKRGVSSVLVSMLIFCLFIASYTSAEETTAPMKKVTKLPFGKWYQPVDYKVSPAVKGYTLPLAKEALEPYAEELAKLRISTEDINLTGSGFTISEKYKTPDIAQFYDKFRSENKALYITVDSILHLYHILFDKVLLEAEEKHFAGYLQLVLDELHAETLKIKDKATTEEGKTAVQLILDYLSVAKCLLTNSNGNSEKVNKELQLIAAHTGFAPSPLFEYREDYSQYVPRGHYTQSETLRRYFKSMMWLGRMTFLVKGKEKPNDEAAVTIETARIQTLAAILLANELKGLPSYPKYKMIYEFTSFFVGYSDDLTPLEYSRASAGFLANPFTITDPDTFRKLQLEILKETPPAIYSGLGEIQVDDIVDLLGKGDPSELQKALQQTMGMRLMGQRFVIDSYMMGKLVYPTIGRYAGREKPFTGSPDRYFPTGLDVMSILGSENARKILQQGDMTNYDNYDLTCKGLEAEIKPLTKQDWNRNLYMGWLYTLKGLFEKTGNGYQPFQQTSKWEDRQLLASLGSWTALRHDTILYAKQSYTLEKGAAPPAKPKTLAYVEAEPECWARLLALHNTMVKGIDAFKLNLDYDITSRFRRFTALLGNLLEASIAQLEEKPLSNYLTNYLENIADYIKGIQGDVFKEYRTTIVADVHTDTNSQMVLEEATGPMMTMVVVCANADGSISIAYGPVYTYYEFKHPVSDRLTDEKWNHLIKQEKSELPGWVNDLTSKEFGKPLPQDRF